MRQQLHLRELASVFLRERDIEREIVGVRQALEFSYIRVALEICYSHEAEPIESERSGHNSWKWSFR